MITKKHISTILLAILALGLVIISFGSQCTTANDTTLSYEIEWVQGENYSLVGNLLSKSKFEYLVKFSVHPNDDGDTAYYISDVIITAKPINGPEYIVKGSFNRSTGECSFVMPSAPVTVSAVAKENCISEISVNFYKHTTYGPGDKINKNVLDVTVYYFNGDMKNVFDYTIRYKTGDCLSEGDTEIYIEYTENGVTLITSTDVDMRYLTGLSFSGDLYNTLYVEHTELTNIDGLTITAEYSDNTSKTLDFSELTIIYENPDDNHFNVGDTSFQLYYSGKSITVAGITVREFEAYEDIDISLALVGTENTPTLIVSGKLKDALSVTIEINSGDSVLHTQNATIESGYFTCSVDLSTALAIGNENVEYGIKLYYSNTKYIDLLSSMCQNLDARVKHNDKIYSLADSQGNLMVKFAPVETNIDTLTLTYENDIPTLYILGTTTDPDLKIRISDTSDFSDNVYDGSGFVMDTGVFEFTYDLNNLPASSNWYDIKVVSTTTVNIHINDLTTPLSQTTFYGTTTKIDVVSWNDSSEETLSFDVSTFTVRDVTVELKSIGNPAKPHIEIEGIVGDASTLYMYLGTTKIGEGNLTNKTLTCLIDLTTVTGIDLNTVRYLGIATTDNATNPTRIASSGNGAEIQYDGHKYSLLTDNGEYAVKITQLNFDINVTIINMDNIPMLDITAPENAITAIIVGDCSEGYVYPTDTPGIVKARVEISVLFVVGQAHYITVFDHEGNGSELLAANVGYSGSVTIELSTKPRDDMYAENTYSFIEDDGKLAVVYEQSVYKDADNTLVATIKQIGIDADNKFFFSYSNENDYYGALRSVTTNEIKQFSQPTLLGNYNKRTVDIETGEWAIEYTTSTLNDMDNPLSIVFDDEYFNDYYITDTICFYHENGIMKLRVEN